MNLYKPVLSSHDAVGLDIDHTLINGPHSFSLRNWVENHHHDRDLHIITFRTGKDLDLVWNDLTAAGFDQKMFSGLHSIPPEIGQTFWRFTQKVGHRCDVKNYSKFLRGLKHHKISLNEYADLESQVRHWKGMKCSELGLTALVDDLKFYVEPGCLRHGIQFIDALNPEDLPD